MSEILLTTSAPGAKTTAEEIRAVRAQLGLLPDTITEANRAGSGLITRFRELRTEVNTGAISSRQYGAALREVKAELQGVAQTTGLSTNATRLFGQEARLMEGEIKRTQGSLAGLSKATYGAQALAVALDGGKISARGFASAMATLGAGSPAMQGALIAIAALSLAYMMFRQHVKDAKAEEEAFERHLASLRLSRHVSGVQTQEQLRADLADLQRRRAELPQPQLMLGYGAAHYADLLI